MSGLGQTLRGEARDAVIFTGSNMLNRVGGLLLLPLYWTKLSPSDYGVLAVIAIIGAFQTLFSSLSLDLAVTRFYYEWPDGTRRRNLGAIWTWNWLLTGAVTVAFVAVVPILAPVLFPDITDVSWLVLGVLGTGIGNLFIIPASTIRIRRMPWLFSTYNLIGFVTSSALGLWLVLVRDEGLTGLLISIILANLVLAAIGAGAMLRFSSPALSSPDLGEAVRFSARAIPAALVNTTAQVLDRVLLGFFTDLQTLGLYSVALRFADVINLVHASLKMSFGPFMMKNVTTGGAQGKDLLVAVIPYYLIPYFVVGLGLTLFIEPVIQIIGQPEYFGVERIVPWLVGVNILGCFYFYYCNGLFLAKRTGLLLLPAIANLTVLSVASVLLIAPYQLAGLIVSRYISALVLLGVTLYLSQRVFPLDHRWAALARLIGAAVAISLVGLLLVPDDLPVQIVVCTVLLLAFIAASVPLVSGDRRMPPLRRILRPGSSLDVDPAVAPDARDSPLR